MSLIRLIVIIITFARYRLDNLIKIENLSLCKKFFFKILPWRYFVRDNSPRGVRIRKFLETLGPVFVKFGQILSTRRDLIPDDISLELAKLQDKVPPFSGELAQQIIIESFKDHATESDQVITKLFAEFDPEPLASASVAQVHAAKLHTGEKVIVKIIRPNIKKTILQDIELLLLCGKILSVLFPETRRLHLIRVILDYKQTILNELNLLQEAANAAQLRHNFRASDILYIPKIYWEYTKETVLVMERIYGVAVTDINTLQANSVDMKKVATRGVEIFFTQVFRDSFFHADMHPGNIWLDITNPSEPKYLGLDFGIVGSLDPEDQYYLASNLLAFFKRDYRKVAQLHINSGWVPANTRVNELESAIRTVCEPIFGRPLKQISFGMLLVRLFQVARKFNMELQPQLVLLEKTLLNIEGLGRQLCPDLNLWETALPFLENWIQKKASYDVLKDQLQQQGLEFILNAPIFSQKLSSFITDCNKIKNFLLLQQKNKPKTNKLRKKIGYLLLAIGGFTCYSMNLISFLPYLVGAASSFIGLWLLFSSFNI